MNTPAIRVVGATGSGRSAVAAALYKLLNEAGITSELVSCNVDAKSWRTDLRMLMRGKLLPIIVSPTRSNQDIPPVMELMKELATARKSAQDMHKKCQKLENQLAEAEERMEGIVKGNRGYAEGYRAASLRMQDERRAIRSELEKEFERKLAAYKDATRSEMQSLRFGTCPDAYMAVHKPESGKSTPHIILSYHRPTEGEVKDVCGYPEGGKITCSPIMAPLVPPKTT